MSESNRSPLVVAFAVVVVLFLIFGGGTMTGSMMNSGMMGQGYTGGYSWMWIPTVFILVLGVVLGWMLFGQKK